MSGEPTPIRQQYLRVKKKYPGAIVLFRLGDFYETFDEDARAAARELEITLTSREMGKDQRVPMAGIPYHALDNYLARLINRGYKVAICEQITRPGDSRGLVEREVVRLVTPGTVVEPGLLDSKTNNYLAALVVEGDSAGLAYIDITTSEFAVTQLPLSRLAPELARLKPSEIIAPASAELAGPGAGIPVTRLEDYRFDFEEARQTLLAHFGVATLDGYGCAGLPLAVCAAGAAIHYVREAQKGCLGQIGSLKTYSTEFFMTLDAPTVRNLEIFRTQSGAVAGSLLSVLDLTRTPMGGRLLKRWLGQPLLDVAELGKRQDAIAWFADNLLARRSTNARLGQVSDIERLINRVRGGIAAPRELAALKTSLEAVPGLQEIVREAPGWLTERLKPCPDVVGVIGQAISDQPPATLEEGGVIREGFHAELDELRGLASDSRRYLAGLEQRERERTGIKSLKVGYNRVFGYYIEVSRPNLSQAPAEYIRKQTLANGERFYTPELKEYESRILTAQERIIELETDLFRRVCRQVAELSESVLAVADALARVDVLGALGEAAARYGYARPALSDDDAIVIKEGRHPVLERAVESGFVPNDTDLSNREAQLIIITGPNMSGKSTYLRQVALIVLMAQVGSFVPAASARIGLVDRIFTRIGARDDLAAGQSTFMVEMTETASILNNAAPRSLIILDEIGRGTSTYDGLSIARAVAEYIHNSPKLGSRTLFATHYHEMVELAGYLPRVRNFNVAVTESGGEVTFLHKIVPGGVDRSYGIHVARLAGLPRAVVHRAGEVLNELERDGRTGRLSGKARRMTSPQLPLPAPRSPALETLQSLELDSLTPLEALNRLYELQKAARAEY